MKIRKVDHQDSNEIYKWRNNIKSREMSLNSRIITIKEHNKWFKDSVKNNNREILIGEIDDSKIGVCRFEFNKELNISEVSININPVFRSRGYGKELLKNSIEYYLNKKNCILKAQIKLDNIVSKKLFLSIGFYIVNEKKNVIEMEFKKKLKFKKVEKSDALLLYELLKKRVHNISHQYLPDFETHKNFVDSNPYLHWYKYYLFDKVIGTFYIKSDNSIGIYLDITEENIVSEILDFIFTNFSPQEPIPSIVPNHFFINISETNQNLKNIIESLGYIKFQVSYKPKN